MLTVIWPTELYVKSTIEKIDQCKKYMYIYHCIAYTTDSVNLYQSQKKKKLKSSYFWNRLFSHWTPICDIHKLGDAIHIIL